MSRKHHINSLHTVMEVATSRPIWGFLLYKFIHSVGSVFLSFGLPLYIVGYHYPTRFADMGVIFPFIPQITAIAAQPLIGIAFDLLQNSGIYRFQDHHKQIICIGCLVEGVLFLLSSFITSLSLDIITFSIIRIVMTIGDVTSGNVPGSITPHYSNILNGFGVAVYTIGLVLNQLVFVPLMVYYPSDNFVPSRDLPLIQSSWNGYFYLVSGISVVCCVVYFVNGSAELQPWDDEVEEAEYSRDEQKKMEHKVIIPYHT